MQGFMDMLREQRWDDHRFYHHNRVNQSLHLFSSLCFIVVYPLLFANPLYAAFLGWPIAMISRQIGHFFFEPKGFDEKNQVTHEYKESVKVGYNLRRKVLLLSLWSLVPFVLYLEPTFFGLFDVHTTKLEFLDHLARLWIALGIGAVAFRAVHLFFIKDVKTGVVWATKIVTDPFHDVMLYYRAPLQVLRGEMYDPSFAPQAH